MQDFWEILILLLLQYNGNIFIPKVCDNLFLLSLKNSHWINYNSFLKFLFMCIGKGVWAVYAGYACVCPHMQKLRSKELNRSLVSYLLPQGLSVSKCGLTTLGSWVATGRNASSFLALPPMLISRCVLPHTIHMLRIWTHTILFSCFQNKSSYPLIHLFRPRFSLFCDHANNIFLNVWIVLYS